MKNIFKFSLAVLAMSAAVSCQQDLKEDMTPVKDNQVFTATINADTKAVFDEVSLKTLWKGDADGNEYITIMEPGNVNKFVAKGVAEPTDMAVFELVEGQTGIQGNSACAVYPAGDWTCFANQGEAGLVLGANINFATEQVATAGTFDPKAPVAVAYNFDLAKRASFAFKNATALLKIRVGETETPITSVKVTALGGEALSGDMVLTLEGNVETIKGAETALNYVELKGELTPSTNYYIAVAPGVLAGGVEVKLNNDDAMTYKITKEIEFVRNRIYYLGLFPIVEPNTANNPMGNQYTWYTEEVYGDEIYRNTFLLDFGFTEEGALYNVMDYSSYGQGWVSYEKYTDLTLTQIDNESGYLTWTVTQVSWDGTEMINYFKLSYSELTETSVKVISQITDEIVVDADGNPVIMYEDAEMGEVWYYTYSGIGIGTDDGRPVYMTVPEAPIEFTYQEPGGGIM